MAKMPDRRETVVIENIRPLVDGGRWPLKREPGDWVTVGADIFRCSHEKYDACILFRHSSRKKWERAEMKFVDNDYWEGRFQVKSIGFYEYKVQAWTVAPPDLDMAESTLHEVRVDPMYARTCAWYEMFPRSQGTNPKGPASWNDCITRLSYVKDLGFDTIYLVPIHPVGETNRKGANNSLKAKPGEPGCPYAVGNSHGGHYAVDPELGTMEDFELFMSTAHEMGFRMALDVALNCSPDHPHVKEHPDWYYHEADGSIKFAENPPKKYEDIYPYNYLNDDYKNLWTDIRDTLLYWADKGFQIFRIDNPHTKPFAFWEWLIRDIKEKRPEVVFLSEAFTRPKMMQRLAKAGFDQSYTYFTWRTEKWEIEEYFTELTQTPIKEYMRGILFPTTPDIFPKILHRAGPEAFRMRLMLAGTLSSLYGMYNGYELCENEPHPVKEELNFSEKYQYFVHDWNRTPNIKAFVKALNTARNGHPALSEYDNLHFHHCDNPQITVYSKRDPESGDTILCCVNLDVHHVQSGRIWLSMDELGLENHMGFYVKDLLTGEGYVWRGPENFVILDPAKQPGHLFAVVRI